MLIVTYSVNCNGGLEDDEPCEAYFMHEIVPLDFGQVGTFINELQQRGWVMTALEDDHTRRQFFCPLHRKDFPMPRQMPVTCEHGTVVDGLDVCLDCRYQSETRNLTRVYPASAVAQLIADGMLEKYADCGRCVGHEVCRYDDGHMLSYKECVAVYILNLPTEEGGDGE